MKSEITSLTSVDILTPGVNFTPVDAMNPPLPQRIHSVTVAGLPERANELLFTSVET